MAEISFHITSCGIAVFLRCFQALEKDIERQKSVTRDVERQARNAELRLQEKVCKNCVVCVFFCTVIDVIYHFLFSLLNFNMSTKKK
jgi:hypothetical protein